MQTSTERRYIGEDFPAPTAAAWGSQHALSNPRLPGRKQEKKTISSNQLKSHSQIRSPAADLRRKRNQQQKQKPQRLNVQHQTPLPPPPPPQTSHPLDHQQYIYYNNNDWQENADDQAELDGFDAQPQPPSQRSQFYDGTEGNDNNDCCPLDIEDTCEDEDEYDGDSCSPQPLPAELRRRRQQGLRSGPSIPPVRRCPVRCAERHPVAAAAAAVSQQNNCDPMHGHPRGLRRQQQQQPLQQCCRRQSVQRLQMPPSYCKYDPQPDCQSDIYDGPVCEPPRRSAGINVRGNSCGDGGDSQKIHLIISVIGNCSSSLKTADAAPKADFDYPQCPRSSGGNCMPIWGGDGSHVAAAGSRVARQGACVPPPPPPTHCCRTKQRRNCRP